MSGADQFKAWIKRRRFETYKAAATYLGLDQSIVTKIANGKRNPGLAMALRLERLAGIPVKAWESGASDSSVKGRRGKPRNAMRTKGLAV